MRLKDQVAIVTGGGGGLGEGICLCLAREGAHVVVSDVKLELAEKVAVRVKETGQESLAVQTDVRMPEQCEKLIEKTHDSISVFLSNVLNTPVDETPLPDAMSRSRDGTGGATPSK